MKDAEKADAKAKRGKDVIELPVAVDASRCTSMKPTPS